LPNIERKQRLPPCSSGDRRQSSTATIVLAKGEALFDAICKEGGEGIIAKKAKAPYRGARAKNWLKVKCIQRQEFVIVGWQSSDKRRASARFIWR
jgi:bifunctional non-homologous end joining protein LigD